MILLERMKEIYKRGITGLLYVSIILLCLTHSYLSYFTLFLILTIFSLYEMWKLRKGKKKFIALLYVIIPFFLVQIIAIDSNFTENKFNSTPILLLFILTWIFDTFAFLTGRKFGKNKILPKISPKKSWEGFFGGTIFTLLASYIITNHFTIFSIYNPITISLFIPFTATTGDFIESYYKREAKVKDSGNLLPGHGGILDRMDAFMITIPILYIYINYII